MAFTAPPAFTLRAKKADIQAHIGRRGDCTEGGRYTLLVESRDGYQNLCRLITRMKLRAGTKNPKPGMEAAATFDDLDEFSRRTDLPHGRR